MDKQLVKKPSFIQCSFFSSKIGNSSFCGVKKFGYGAP